MNRLPPIQERPTPAWMRGRIMAPVIDGGEAVALEAMAAASAAIKRPQMYLVESAALQHQEEPRLSHGGRVQRAIISSLSAAREESMRGLIAATGLEYDSISTSIQKLIRRGFVASRRVGRCCMYSLVINEGTP